MTASMTTLLAWFEAHPLAAGALIVWTLVWKGLALWKAAGLRHQYWFIALLVINTVGLLEIFYLFFIARGYEVEVVENSRT